MTTFSYPSELKHFGILGQKWGIRRFQNPDGTLTEEGRRRYGYSDSDSNVIPKGTVAYRSSVNPNETFTSGNAYISISKVDRDYYRGGGGAGWLKEQGKSKDLYEYKIKLKDDVRLAKKEDVLKAIHSMDKKVFNEMLKEGQKVYAPFANQSVYEAMLENKRWPTIVDEERKKHPDIKPDTEEFKKLIRKCADKYEKECVAVSKKVIKDYMNLPLEEAFDKGIARSFGRNEKLRNQVIDKLKSQGFNAMIDQASVGVKNKWAGEWVIEGDAPMIVFDRNSLDVEKVSKISRHDASKSEKDFYRWKANATKEAEKRGYYK